MNYILFDGTVRNSLLPFTYTRPVADIRVGILTIREKWERYLGYTTTTITEDYLADKFPMVEMENNILINASFLPNPELVMLIQELQANQAVFFKEEVIAFFTTEAQENVDLDTYEAIEFEGEVIRIEHPWDIFRKNGEAMEADFELITEGRESAVISRTNTVIAPENIFIEEGARVECCILNATNGPIYIGRGAEVMEGAMIRGGFALGEESIVKMGTKVYGPTTVGPHCKIGGEVTNSVLFGYSNKGHEGYLGNSVIGEWCNLGADTNNSNLKNNYELVKIWSYEDEKFAPTGLQFCGLMMADHSKCGINTMFNTGTVIGVSANIYGSGFPRSFIPSFSWGGSGGFTTYMISKALETARLVMGRRNIELTKEDEAIFEYIFEADSKWRRG